MEAGHQGGFHKKNNWVLQVKQIETIEPKLVSEIINRIENILNWEAIFKNLQKT